MKPNCWEVKNCGREPGGKNENELGACPAAVEEKADGINFGKNGGRACWALAGTFCDGSVQATFAKKMINCIQCPFYKQVLEEEGRFFVPSLEIHELIEDQKKQHTLIRLLYESS